MDLVRVAATEMEPVTQNRSASPEEEPTEVPVPQVLEFAALVSQYRFGMYCIVGAYLHFYVLYFSHS